MKTLDRYIIRTFVGTAASVLMGLMVLRILMDMFFNMDEFAEHGAFALVVRAMLLYYGHHAFEYFTQLGGVIVVFSAVFTVWRMNCSNELIAILASGISLHRIVWPIVVCSMLLGGVIILDQELVIPRIAPKLVLQRDGSDEMTEQTFGVAAVSDKYRAIWNASNFEGQTRRMFMPLSLARDRTTLALLAAVDSTGFAEPADMPDEQGWIVTDAVLERWAPGITYDRAPTSNEIYTTVGGPQLLNAAKQALLEAGLELPAEYNRVKNLPVMSDPVYDMEIAADKLRLERVAPDMPITYTLFDAKFSFFADTANDGRRLLGTFLADSAEWVDAPENANKHWRLNGGRLFITSDLTVDDLLMQQSDKWMVYMSSAQLARLLSSGKATDPDGAKIARNIRIADPVNNLVMLLLGLPFILSRERNIKASALLCLIMVGAFFAFTYICRYMGLGPFWAAFMPIVLFGPISLVMLDSVKT